MFTVQTQLPIPDPISEMAVIKRDIDWFIGQYCKVQLRNRIDDNKNILNHAENDLNVESSAPTP